MKTITLTEENFSKIIEMARYKDEYFKDEFEYSENEIIEIAKEYASNVKFFTEDEVKETIDLARENPTPSDELFLDKNQIIEELLNKREK